MKIDRNELSRLIDEANITEEPQPIIDYVNRVLDYYSGIERALSNERNHLQQQKDELIGQVIDAEERIANLNDEVEELKNEREYLLTERRMCSNCAEETEHRINYQYYCSCRVCGQTTPTQPVTL